VRATFQGLLNLALTRGRATSGQLRAGVADPRAAIDAVAYDHPDAKADGIAAAYNAFDREHGER